MAGCRTLESVEGEGYVRCQRRFAQAAGQGHDPVHVVACRQSDVSHLDQKVASGIRPAVQTQIRAVDLHEDGSALVVECPVHFQIAGVKSIFSVIEAIGESDLSTGQLARQPELFVLPRGVVQYSGGLHQFVGWDGHQSDSGLGDVDTADSQGPRTVRF